MKAYDILSPNEHVWVIILAAGEGKRVKNLTRDRWGKPAPKQFSLIDGRSTLLDITLERAKRIAPPERIVAVVARQQRQWWVSELADIPFQNVIVQPENRGTAAGILLPLLWITRHDPDALLVILPSDHHVAREGTLRSAVADAISCAVLSQAGIVLLGVQPEEPETDYGWIVPRSGGTSRLRSVASFREKPDAATAGALLERGGLLNTFILIADGRSLVDLFETALPQLFQPFTSVFNKKSAGSWQEHEVAGLYRSVPNLDFSKDLLERVAEELRVYPVPSCGWLDLGTPERLSSHLIEHGQTPSHGQVRPAVGGSDHVPQPGLGRHDANEAAVAVPTHAVA